MAWMAHVKPLKDGGAAMAAAASIDDARKNFEGVSNAMIASLKQFGPAGGANVNVFHCPMALGGKGADWIQSTEGTENPYYGSKMFKCGDLTESIKGRGAKDGANPAKDEHAGHQHNADAQPLGKKSK